MGAAAYFKSNVFSPFAKGCVLPQMTGEMDIERQIYVYAYHRDAHAMQHCSVTLAL